MLAAAIAVTLIRLALPGIGAHRETLETRLSTALGYPLTLQAIRAEWHGWTPYLELEGLALYSPDGARLISRFDSAEVSLDVPASLLRLTVVPDRLAVRGLALELRRRADGSVTLGDVHPQAAAGGGGALPAWLLGQRHIVLEAATLTWQDADGGETLQFDEATLALRTDGTRTQIDLSAPLPGALGRRLRLALDVTGDLLTSDWDGTVYLAVDDAVPDRWLAGQPVRAAGGQADLRLWTRWGRSKLQDFSAAIEVSGTRLETDGGQLPVRTLVASAYGERFRRRDWQVDVRLAHLQTAGHRWPAGLFRLKLEDTPAGRTVRLFAEHLNLADLAALTARHPALESRSGALNPAAVTGQLDDAMLVIAPDKPPVLQTRFREVALGSRDGRYAAAGLNGRLRLADGTLAVALESAAANLTLGPLYDAPLDPVALTADLSLPAAGEGLTIRQLRLAHDGLTLHAAGRIRPGPGLDLMARLEPVAVHRIIRALPRPTDPDFRAWLNAALAAGGTAAADVLVRGAPAAFPYPDADGQFEALIRFEDTQLHYHPDWPPLEDLALSVRLENDTLSAHATQARVVNAKIETLTAEIASLSSTGNDFRIGVSAEVTGSIKDAVAMIRQSPLGEEPALAELAAGLKRGDLTVGLGLDIPLGDAKTAVDGRLDFEAAELAPGGTLSGLALTQLTGRADFTRERFSADKLTARAFNQPVVLTVPEQDAETDRARFTLSGRGSPAGLVAELARHSPALSVPTVLTDRLDGEGDWTLALEQDTAGGVTTATFSTDLAGVAIDLPAPLGKDQAAHRPLDLHAELGEAGPVSVDVNYDNTLYAEWRAGAMRPVRIGLGRPPAGQAQGTGIVVEGRLAALAPGDWAPFFDGGGEHPLSLDLDIDALSVRDQPLGAVRLTLAQQDDVTQLELAGEQVSGSATLTEAGRQKHLRLALDHLRLIGPLPDDATVRRSPDWPDIDLHITDLTLGERALGEVTLTTRQAADALVIDALTLRQPGVEVTASGRWEDGEAGPRSTLYATLKAASMDTLMTAAGYDETTIADGETQLSLSADWPGTPLDFSVGKLGGTLALEIGRGQLLDVEPAAGRLFGLLSIQTLPRRLALDFTDLFREGFAFDRIKGTFSLQQGDAYTNDLEMTGPSAHIVVSGRTGLIAEDYDQVATVTPKITSSLPVASALFGPVGIGVGAVIYLTGELFDTIPENIDNILRVQYSIKGSWAEPAIEKLAEPEGG